MDLAAVAAAIKYEYKISAGRSYCTIACGTSEVGATCVSRKRQHRGFFGASFFGSAEVKLIGNQS